jgi:hypothetical protein
MTNSGNLWAIGYSDMERAKQIIRDAITNLAWDKHRLILEAVSERDER